MTLCLLFEWLLVPSLSNSSLSTTAERSNGEYLFACALHHATAMLSISDRQQKFEQLRAQWEAADTGQSTSMVGRRVKPAPQVCVRDDLQQNTGSKFRRKLSNGLALISLTQRKTVSGRQPSSNASLALSAPSTNDSSTAILDHDICLSLLSDATLTTISSDTPSQEGTRASEDLQTPRALSRSRTFSYIPRPVKLDTESSPTAEREVIFDTSRNAVMTDSITVIPSRIPTPSLSSEAKCRVSSPRQYASGNLQPLQVKTARNRQSFTAVATGSSSQTAVRSRTNPNLLNRSTPQSASFMAPRKPGPRRLFASSTPQKTMLAENVPASKRIAQRHSQIQDRLTKRESMAVPSRTANRRSFGPDSWTIQNEPADLAPSGSAKRLSVHLVPTPMTAKRVSKRVPQSLHKPPSPCPSEETPHANILDLASTISSVPTLSTVDLLDPPLAPPPKIRTDNNSDAQRRTLGTPNGLGGVWRSSHVFAAANHQVRRLPRSSTFHHFGRRLEPAPPVPAIPNHYKLLSFPCHVPQIMGQDPAAQRQSTRHRFLTTLGKWESSGRSLSSNIVSTQISKEAVSKKSMSTSVSTTLSEVLEDTNEASLTDQTKTLYRFEHEDAGRSIELNNVEPGSPSIPSRDTTSLPPPHLRPDLNAAKRSTSLSFSDKLTRDTSKHRRWSISQRFYPNSADEDTCVQVKDYMPPLYWAGRFQSRFDRWRTEAMTAQLNPGLASEDDGPLDRCTIDDERRAIVLTFMQLRDLCASVQAADSFHVSVPSVVRESRTTADIS